MLKEGRLIAVHAVKVQLWSAPLWSGQPRCVYEQLFFPLIQAGTPAHGMGLPTFKEGFLTLVNLI